jgi:hypothetical protein
MSIETDPSMYDAAVEDIEEEVELTSESELVGFPEGSQLDRMREILNGWYERGIFSKELLGAVLPRIEFVPTPSSDAYSRYGIKPVAGLRGEVGQIYPEFFDLPSEQQEHHPAEEIAHALLEQGVIPQEALDKIAQYLTKVPIEEEAGYIRTMAAIRNNPERLAELARSKGQGVEDFTRNYNSLIKAERTVDRIVAWYLGGRQPLVGEEEVSKILAQYLGDDRRIIEQIRAQKMDEAGARIEDLQKTYTPPMVQEAKVALPNEQWVTPGKIEPSQPAQQGVLAYIFEPLAPFFRKPPQTQILH